MHEKKKLLKKELDVFIYAKKSCFSPNFLWVHVDELGISYFHAFVVNGVEGK